MNKTLIVDASRSDRLLMSGLLVKSGYDPIAVDGMEAAGERFSPSRLKILCKNHRQYRKLF